MIFEPDCDNSNSNTPPPALLLHHRSRRKGELRASFVVELEKMVKTRYFSRVSHIQFDLDW